MTDERYSLQDLRDALDEVAPARAPARLRSELLRSMDRVEPRPRWVAVLREPPMRFHSRAAVGSRTVRLGYVVIVTALLAFLAIGGAVVGASLLSDPIRPDPSCRNGFCPGWPLTVTRAYQTATRLLDGTVLIVGGEHEQEVNDATAELWDRAEGTSVPAGPLVKPHAHHTATLLPDGRVLVVGGLSNADGSVVASAELYDPTTRLFTATGSLAVGRGYHTATAMPDGRVLIVGGLAQGYAPVATAELWDPITGTFGPAGTLGTPRASHTATLLLDGRVLVIGGEDTPWNSFDSVELWDPGSLTFRAAETLVQARTLHTATALPDGRVLVIGGGMDGRASRNLDSVEIWDPGTGTIEPTGSLTHARAAHTATALPDGRVLVIGGELDLSSAYLASAEAWDPTTGAFSPAGSLSQGRTEHTATLLDDGRVLVTGGWSGSNVFIDSTEIWDPRQPAGASARPSPMD